MTPEMKAEMQYAGAIGLLCEFHLQAPNHGELVELKEQAREAISDWAELTGWEVKRILDRIELIPPKG
jgi:hypothetical protein